MLQEITDLRQHVTKPIQEKIDARVGTMALGPMGLAIGTTTTELDNGTPFSYLIDGTVRNKNKGVDFETGAGTVFGNPAAHALFLVSINAAGTFVVTQGTSAVVANAIALPAVPADHCPCGIIYVFTAAAATFLMGTTAWNAASVTSTFHDIHGMSLGSQGVLGPLPQQV